MKLSNIKILSILIVLTIALSGCATSDHHSETGKAPKHSSSIPMLLQDILNITKDSININKDNNSIKLDISNKNILSVDSLRELDMDLRCTHYIIKDKNDKLLLLLGDKERNKILAKLEKGPVKIAKFSCRTYTIDVWYLIKGEKLTPFWGEIYPSFANDFE